MKTVKQQSLFQITWPLFIEIALHMSLGIIATLILSYYSDSAAAAVGVSNQVLNIFIILFNITSVGATIIIGQYLGAKRVQDARQTARSAFSINLYIGLIISVLVALFGTQLLGFFSLEGKTLMYGETFLKIVGLFLFLEAISLTLGAILRSHGFTKNAMYVTLLMNFVSAFGNVIAVLGLFGIPVLGVAGVAWSIVVARTVAVVLLFFVVYRKLSLRFKLKDLIQINRRDIKSIMNIGIPSAGEGVSYQFSQLIITGFIATIGEAALSARVYVSNITMLCFLFTLAIAQGTQLLVARQVGAQQFEAAHKRALKTLKIAVFASFVSAVALASFGTSIMSLFTSSPEIIAIGVPLLWASVILEPGRAMNIVLMGTLKSAGDVRFPVAIGILSMWGIAVVLSYTLGLQFGLGLLGIWIAFSADEWFRGLFALKRWNSRKWAQYAVVKGEQHEPNERRKTSEAV
ncbi:MATE family efflux transporter [Exiguobacterium sp. RIT452]|uniref:MATE family efflux transporter n=1 Tax=Exiguobacterium undae TaxID=169177 RepID=A0ABX2VD78_9BACL|nr:MULTISPECIES: MATE family efflux transporter [Exiguobacterium]OAN16182.1 MATE family efflux transporter [Exiguobacterium undae]RJP01844.1 MATE family efflux transporter [Exiguobacterium sp. RIT452]HSN66972.1 MATE family efflux transporter [Fusibacter sp.]